MNFMRVNLAFAVIQLSAGLYAQDKEITVQKTEEKTDNSSNAKIVINFNEDQNGEGEESYKSGVNRLIDNNRAISSGIAQGSLAINHSIESLMESVFYSILDRDFYYDITDNSQFAFKTRRELFPTTQGSYVVVDRFSLGPEYSKVLHHINKIPVSLGLDGKVNVFDIYVRTDGMRIAESQELPFWRRALNNWLGLLPLISAILPPSFNPNELYDPVNLVATPFSFPLTVGGFYTMTVGSIRSYNISGGITVPIDFGAAVAKDIRDALQKLEGLKVTLPYSVFLEGEYRINVLRKSENIAWVGLTTTKEAGHKFNTQVANILKVFTKVSPYWGGVPLKFFPLDAELKKSKVYTFNQLYELDLNKRSARKAYRLAVRGEFGEVYKQHKIRKDTGLDTGVTFHFTRNEDAWQGEREKSTNLMLLSKVRIDKRSETEVKIVDEQGTTYALEAKKENRQEFTEVLTGKQTGKNDAQVEIKVIKVPVPKKDRKFWQDDFEYAFPENEPNPYQITFTQRIQDRYMDAFEYDEYVEQLRFFTKLELKDLPNLPRRDPKVTLERRQLASLIDPSEDQTLLHVTPSYIGRFGASAVVYFSTKVFEDILKTPVDRKWEALASAYGLDTDFWKERQSREGWLAKSSWMGASANVPLSFFNMRLASWDFIAEANAIVDAMAEIQSATTPMTKLNAFYNLFDTNYPDKLSHVLLLLSNLPEVPRSVSFSSDPKSKNLDKDIKAAFKKLNNRMVRTLKDFPPPPRERISKEKLNAFFPDELQESRKRPTIVKVDVDLKMLPKDYLERVKYQPEVIEEIGMETLTRPQIYVRLHIKNMKPARPGKIYLKCDQSGKVQLGKFVLNEQVINILPTVFKDGEEPADLGVLVYEFYLTGPLSPLSGTFFNNAINYGGEFEVTVSSSTDGGSWSDERLFKFYYEDGILAPP